MEKLVIIGGNAAGLTAASRAKRIDPTTEHHGPRKTPSDFLQHLRHSVFSVESRHAGKSGFLLSGKFRKGTRHQGPNPGACRMRLFRRDAVLKARAWTPARKSLILRPASHRDRREAQSAGYSRNITFRMFSRWSILADAMRIRDPLRKLAVCVIVGAGYVGLELAECFHSLGKSVHIFEQEPQVLSSIDPDMAQIIEYELRRFGVGVSLKCKTPGPCWIGWKERPRQRGEGGLGTGCHARRSGLLDTGVEPNIDLTAETDIRIGLTGGIAVNPIWKPQFPGVYAAGNCAETWCPIRRRPVLNFIGTVAAKQGRIAGENMAARRTKFFGAIGTTVLKVFDLNVARTGLTTHEAALERMDVVSDTNRS